MQSRPYPEKSGVRIWLTRDEAYRLLEAVDDEPRRQIAFQLGLHGLRTDEIVPADGFGVQPRHFRELDAGGHILVVPDGKTGKREVPISEDLYQSVRYLKSADSQLNERDPVIDKSKRTIRNWMQAAREVLLDETPDADSLGMHDLRRSWATDSYYSLAFAGVPIAEQLVMSWGGWKQTTTGRETFRQNYLGPVPDHVTARAMEDLPLY